MLELIQSIRRTVSAIAFNAYLAAEESSILERLATVIDNRQLQEDPVNLEWVGEFFEMREWIDEKTTQRVFKGDFSIPIKAYESTASLDRKKFKRPNSIAAAIPIAQRMAAAFARGKIKLVADTFRANPLAYDGQNLFDTDHVHPDTKGTYSNILAPNWTDPAAPTVDEAKAFLHDAFGRLITNRAIQAEILDTSKIQRDLLVIAHNVTTWATFNKVATMPVIDDKENELRGTFGLLQDMRPTAGQENFIEVLHSAPGAPRPVIFVIDEEPGELKIDAGSEFKNRHIDMGLEGYYGTKPGWPQVVVQGQPT